MSAKERIHELIDEADLDEFDTRGELYDYLHSKVDASHSHTRRTAKAYLDDAERPDRKDDQGDSTDEDGESESNYETWQEWAENEEETESEGFTYTEDYYYNEHDDKYVIWPLSRSRSIVIPGHIYRSIREDYSNWSGDQSTINEICRTHGISRKDFIAIKRTFGFVHDDSPFTDEQLRDEGNEIEDYVHDLARLREREIEKQWQRKKWKQTENMAEKWQELKRGYLDPLTDGIDSAPVKISRNLPETNREKLVELYPTDMHIDQINHDGTGFGEATKVLLYHFRKMVGKIKERHDPDVVGITLGNDQFHIDTPQGTTTLGTAQDYSKIPREAIFQVGRVGIEFVEVARELDCYVRVRTVPGNHDSHTATGFHARLMERYRDHDDVIVKGRAGTYQVDQFGNSLIGKCHGDKIRGGQTQKASNLSNVMSCRHREAWGETCWSYWLSGHIHQMVEKDDGSHMIVAPTPNKESKWASDKGFTSERAFIACVFDKVEGLENKVVQGIKEGVTYTQSDLKQCGT